MNTAVSIALREEKTTSPLHKAEKERKKFLASPWQLHLKQVIKENKGKGMKLGEITKLASKSYKKST